jgi:excisionase family DNA binding protein
MSVSPVPYARPRLLTPAEVAHELRLGRLEVYRHISKGELPVVRLGTRAVRVPADALDKFIAERTIGDV